MASTITSATASLFLTIPGVFPTAQKLQQWAADDAFDVEAVAIADTQVGVDGQGTAGWVPVEVPMTINFLANSFSIAIFEQWKASMDAQQDIIYALGQLRANSLGRSYSMGQGVLTRYPALPTARRVFAPRRFTITWQPALGIPAIIGAPLQ